MYNNVVIQLVVILGLSGTALAKDRKFTIINSCGEQICPGMTQSDSPSKMAMPSGNNGPFGGFCLEAGAERVLTLPDQWSGRLWGRSGCDASGKCLTGDCGGIECQHGGAKPATLAEMTLAIEGRPELLDHYDISLVDGFNIPASLRITGDGCRESVCEGNANAHCPDPLRAAINADGINMGCQTACESGFGMTGLLGPNGAKMDGSMNCCSGAWALPGNCPSDCIDYYSVMKDACTTGYSYAYDENSQTALSACKEQGDYTLEFCPTQKDFKGNAGGDTKYASDIADKGKCAAVPMMPGFTIVTPATKLAGGGNAPAPAPAAPGPASGSPSGTTAAIASDPASVQPAQGDTSVVPPAPAPKVQTSQVEAPAPKPTAEVPSPSSQHHRPPHHTRPAAAVIMEVGETLASAPEPSLVKKCDEDKSARKRSGPLRKKRKARRSRQLY